MVEETLNKYLPGAISIIIMSLGAASGFYTFSGIGLLVDDTSMAVILAIVVQITIITTVLSIPFVKGFLRPIIFLFYIIFLIISSATAYIYIFNKQSDSGDINKHDMQFLIAGSEYINALNNEINKRLENQFLTTEQLKRDLQEEKEHGRKSGRGPGEGDSFYVKEEEWLKAKDKYSLLKSEYGVFKSQYQMVKKQLGMEKSSQSYASTILLIYELESISGVSLPEEKKKFELYINSLKSPVEKAVEPFRQGSYYSISVISSIIWSAIFDAASLIMGILLIHITVKKVTFFDRIIGFIRHALHSFKTLRGLPKEIRGEILQIEGDVLSVGNRDQLHKFGARLAAACSAVSQDNKIDPMDPLKMIVSNLKVLNFTEYSKSSETEASNDISIGILNADVDRHPMLHAIISIMSLEKMFTINYLKSAFELNLNNELALDMIIHLINNPHLIKSPSIIDYYPKLLVKKREIETNKKNENS